MGRILEKSAVDLSPAAVFFSAALLFFASPAIFASAEHENPAFFSAEELSEARRRLQTKQLEIELLYAIAARQKHSDILKNLKAVHAGSSAALYADAYELYLKSEKSQALLKLQDSLEANKNFDLAHNLTGLIYSEAEEYEKAATSFARALKAAPYEPSYSYNLANALHQQSKYDEAMDVIERALKAKYNSHDFYYLAALIKRDVGNYSQALDSFALSQQFGTHGDDFYKAYLQTAYLGNNLKESLRLSQLLAASPDPEIQRLIGRIRLQTGEFARAMPHLKIVAYHPAASLEDKKAYIFALYKLRVQPAAAILKFSKSEEEKNALLEYHQSLGTSASPAFRDPLLSPPH